MRIKPRARSSFFPVSYSVSASIKASSPLIIRSDGSARTIGPSSRTQAMTTLNATPAARSRRRVTAVQRPCTATQA